MANVNELQEFLFETLQGIKAGTVNVEKAKAIASVSNVMVGAAKVEVEFAKAVGRDASSTFLNSHPGGIPQAIGNHSGKSITANGGVVEKDGAVTRHTLK